MRLHCTQLFRLHMIDVANFMHILFIINKTIKREQRQQQNEKRTQRVHSRLLVV